MKFRVTMWGLIGFFVSAWWVIYAFARTAPISPAEPLVWNLVRLTQPIAWASLHFNFGVTFYWVLIANALTYAFVGLSFESLRRGIRRGSPTGSPRARHVSGRA